FGEMIVALKCLDNSHNKFEEFLQEQLIHKCWDIIPMNRPSASTLTEIFSNWMVEVDDPNSELYIQIKKSEELKTRDIAFLQYTFKMQSEACYTSRLYNLSNLPKLDSL
ncbi:143_t:CDS:2, partial [Racocetra persica]